MVPSVRSFDTISAAESNAACIEERALLARRGADKTQERHRSDAEDHCDIAVIGAGEMAGSRAKASENGFCGHGSHRNWLFGHFGPRD